MRVQFCLVFTFALLLATQALAFQNIHPLQFGAVIEKTQAKNQSFFSKGKPFFFKQPFKPTKGKGNFTTYWLAGDYLNITVASPPKDPSKTFFIQVQSIRAKRPAHISIDQASSMHASAVLTLLRIAIPDITPQLLNDITAATNDIGKGRTEFSDIYEGSLFRYRGMEIYQYASRDKDKIIGFVIEYPRR